MPIHHVRSSKRFNIHILLLLVKDGTWLGLNDIAEEGVWVWSDGSPVTHTKFGLGQPDNSGNEDCVEMKSNGFLNDRSCGVLLHFFCETNYNSINP